MQGSTYFNAIGILTKDFELKTSANGVVYAFNGLAINRKWTTQSGEQKEDVIFINFSLFGKQAENAKQYVGKGSQVYIEGRLANRKVEQKTELQVFVEKIIFLSGKKVEETKPITASKEEEIPEIDYEGAF